MTPRPSRSLSLRDPAGKLVEWDGRLLRSVEPAFEASLTAVEGSTALKRFIADGRLIEFRRLEHTEVPWANAGVVLEHPRVWFPSYPNEWPAEMLRAAGELTLDLAEAALGDGLGLKDATPWNVLFRGPEPVFVDILSFELRHGEDGTWLPYAQFKRTFVYPLLAERHLGLAADGIFFRHRDGWEPESLYRLIGWTKRLRPPFLTLISLPTWAGRGPKHRASLYKQRLTGNPEKAKFLLHRWYGHLRGLLKRVATKPNRVSKWSDYDSDIHPELAAQKERFLVDTLDQIKPKRLLDLGCNTGRHACLAAGRGIETVAADRDHHVIGSLWQRARAERLPLLPIVLDLARPTPGLGWGNQETLSFQERAAGKFDVVLAYAILHHLWVTEGLPMEATVRWLHSLEAPWVLAEHVAPEDRRIEQLRRGRALPDLSRAHFEATCELVGFEIASRESLPGGTRTLFRLRRR